MSFDFKDHRVPWFSNYEASEDYEYDESFDVHDKRVGLHKQADSCFVENITIGNDNYDFYVYDAEGKIPHFHLVVNNEVSVAIEMKKPRYYKRDNGKTKLRDIDIDNMIKILNMRNDRIDRDFTVWELLIYIWNGDYRNRQISYETKIPNYEKLKEIPD